LHSGRGIGGFARVKPIGGMATEGSFVAG
jgi:hypothetical protein